MLNLKVAGAAFATLLSMTIAAQADVVKFDYSGVIDSISFNGSVTLDVNQW